MATSVIKKFRITSDDLDKAITQAILESLNKSITSKRAAIQQSIYNVIDVAFRSNDVITSLAGGELQAEFGLKSEWVGAAQNGIIEGIKKETTLIMNKFKINKGFIEGQISVRFLVKNGTIVMRAPYGSYESNGETIAWVEWLLKKGAHPIILNYFIKYGPYKASRSSRAIMIPFLNASWAVPPQYSGVEDNNFITRTIQTEQFQNAITQAIESSIGDLNVLLR